MLKNYKFGFDIWGLILFLIIMIPNFIWFAVPAPNDILRNTSITEKFDIIASICQVLMITCLCTLLNRNRNKFRNKPLITTVMICCILYFISWIFYYIGIVNALVILGLTISPCMAFLIYSIERKNMVAIVPTVVFTICHLLYGIINHIV